MLKRVYGDNLILDPHVMDVSALKDYSTYGRPLFVHRVASPCPGLPLGAEDAVMTPAA